MLKNYLKIAIRNLFRQKLYSFINIVGLAFSIAVCLLIFLFIREELSYDKFHLNSDRIYRIIRESGDANELTGVTPLPLGNALKTDFPDIEVLQTKGMSNIINYKGNTFTENRFYFTDPNFFKVFSFPLIKGNPLTALKDPNSVVITKEIAKKYFGNENPMGKTLMSNNKDLLIVTGVMENVPEDSQLQFDFLSGISGFVQNWPNDFKNDWHPNMFSTYILLPENYSAEVLAKKLPSFFEKYVGKDDASYQRLKLQPLKDIYLHSSNIKFNPSDKIGDINEIYVFSTIAVFILILACINYMNLSTSRYSNRMNEIGIRKVIGAERLQLIKQFIGESIITCLFAVIISILLVASFLPVFNSVMDKKLEMEIFKDMKFISGLISFVLILGLISGSYPAIFLSSFNPIKIIKGSASPALKNLFTRKILIIVQFTIAVAFLICISIVFFQLNFIKNKNLGFDKENLISIDIPYELRDKFDIYKNEALKNNHVVNMSLAGEIPPNPLGTTNPVEFSIDGKKQILWVRVMSVDFDFIETVGFKVKEGRSFSREFKNDEKEAFIFNETTIKSVGMKNIVGKGVNYFNQIRKVIGVVEDFNYWTLLEKIEPVVIKIERNQCWRIAAKISSQNIAQTINFLKDRWEKIFPSWPFEFTFVDENLNQLYAREIRLEKLAEYLTVLAVCIACLGLFGLSTFTIRKRTKEIGIRKVLGSSVTGIVKLLSKEFLILVCVSNLIAYPAAYYFINKWLQDFAYRINISPWIFALASVGVFAISFLTIVFQVLKAATANPVKSLRYE